MKKGIIITATLAAVVGVTGLVMLHLIKNELECGLNMTPEDFETPE